MANWSDWVWLNGRLVRGVEASVSVLDRSFLLGDGLFETMRVVRRRVLHLEAHLARLHRGTQLFRISIGWDDQQLALALQQVLETNALEEAALRLTVSRGVGPAGPMPDPTARATVIIAARPFAGYPPEWFEQGLRATLSRIIKNERSPLCRVKSTSYAEHVLARLEAVERKTDEALMLNTQGHLVEGSSSNLFAVIEGRLITPELSSGCLPGITRAILLDLAKDSGIKVVEASLLPASVSSWQEAFLTSSLMGIAPLVEVEGEGIGTERRPEGRGVPGPITRMLDERYLAALAMQR
jgi:branched-chain amino acid aminotransferase